MAGLGDDLGAILIEKEWCTEKEVKDALPEDRSESALAARLIAEKVISGEQYAEALAIQNGMEYLPGDMLIGSPDAIDRVPLDFAQQRHILPMEVDGGIMTVAITNPVDLNLVDDLQFLTGLKISCKVVSSEAMNKALFRSYETDVSELGNLINDVTEADISVRTEDSGDSTVDDQDAPVIRLVDAIITKAVRMEASDIHVEAMEKSVRVRYRIDGSCIVVESPPKRLQGALFSRLKLMAKMDISERRKPQDGPIKISVLGRTIDLRVSSLPSSHGESIVMRILDKASVMRGVEELGFHPTDYTAFRELIARPNGIVLVTGPTGSGKTTTLYAALNERNKPNVKIITAEDPVEYNVSGINQIQVNHSIDLSFARILRAMLRQAPNIILVGEIRDRETADVAIEASLTGHLVFSTLHTNDAPSAITRLIDMGVKNYLVSSAVVAILAQRLIKLNCTSCKAEYTPPLEKLLAAGITESMAKSKTFFKGRGCSACNETGYKGRIGIYELMPLTSPLREAIFKNQPTHIIRDIAMKNGMHNLLMDGVRKVFAGLTTVDEVLKVAVQQD
ncbi:MAG: Flp pilus assembly complex ATPase component TadA [Planctomycetes bacterium]|nr:Flp pilus assembly complex ATPase component TadA [Planctomycetota bacterium]